MDVWVRCYEELNDYIPQKLKKVTFRWKIPEGESVSGLIASLGVPVGKIDLILVNGQSVEIVRILENNDRISLFPVFETFNISTVTRMPQAPLRKTAFICDAGLEALCETLKGIGMDVCQHHGLAPSDLIQQSNCTRRIILTTRRRIFEAEGVTRAILLEKESIECQVQQVLYRLDIEAPYVKTG